MDVFNNKTYQSEDSSYRKLYAEVKRLISLQFEHAKLMLVEKLTLLLGRIALVAVAFVISATALIFLSMSVADFLLRGLEPCWTYLIISGFYVLLIVVACCFRRQLIVNPIARYISRVILDPPVKEDVNVHHVSSVKPSVSKQ